MPIREHRECKNKYGPNYFPYENICVGGRGIIARDGDSGGPLTCMRLLENGKVVPVLHGISSYSAMLTSNRLPSVYTQISFHMDFISGTMEEYDFDENSENIIFEPEIVDPMSQRIPTSEPQEEDT